MDKWGALGAFLFFWSVLGAIERLNFIGFNEVVLTQ